MFIDHSPTSLAALFRPLYRSIAHLQSLGMISFHYETEQREGEGPVNRFQLFIKATPVVVDLDEYSKEISLRSANPSYFANNCPVYEVQKEGRTCVGLGSIAGEIDLSTQKGAIAHAMIYVHRNEIIFASGTDHRDAAQHISDYIRWKILNGKESPSTGAIFASSIYYSGVRINFRRSSVDIDNAGKSEVKEATKQALSALGVIEMRMTEALF
jgi:hypothetical protein